MIRSAEREHFVSHFAFVDHVDRVARVWCCPKEQSRETDRLWPLRRIGRISGFCRVSHRLYVTTAKDEHAVLCVRLCVCGDSDGDHWGRWGSRSRPQGLALGDRSRRISLSCLIYHFWASKLFLKKRRKSFIFLHEDKRRKYKENAEKNDI